MRLLQALYTLSALLPLVITAPIEPLTPSVPVPPIECTIEGAKALAKPENLPPNIAVFYNGLEYDPETVTAFAAEIGWRTFRDVFDKQARDRLKHICMDDETIPDGIVAADMYMSQVYAGFATGDVWVLAGDQPEIDQYLRAEMRVLAGRKAEMQDVLRAHLATLEGLVGQEFDLDPFLQA